MALAGSEWTIARDERQRAVRQRRMGGSRRNWWGEGSGESNQTEEEEKKEGVGVGRGVGGVGGVVVVEGEEAEDGDGQWATDGRTTEGRRAGRRTIESCSSSRAHACDELDKG